MDIITQQLIDEYKTPADITERLQDIETVILTGISAAGKDTIKRELLNDPRYIRVVTSTTRNPRENNGVKEQDGIEYYFLTVEEAQEKIHNGEYIEVMNVHGNINGSLIKEYERIAGLGNIALTDIDYQGAAHFLKFDMRRLSVIFVVPPNFDTWLERLVERYGSTLDENQDEVLKRMRSAQTEIAYALEDDRFIPVINDDLDKATNEIKEIVELGKGLSVDEIEYNRSVMRGLHKAITEHLSTVA
jgi:guanylate kinase